MPEPASPRAQPPRPCGWVGCFLQAAPHRLFCYAHERLTREWRGHLR